MAENRSMRLRLWLGFSAVLAIAIGSVIAALIIRNGENENFKQGQQDEAMRSAHQAESLVALSVGQLATAAAFFQLEGEVEGREFDVMSKSLLRQGALAGTAFVRRVKDEERADFEQRHGFSIVEREGLGQLDPAADRDVYFPVTFAAADKDTGPSQGFDIGSDPGRARFLNRARDSGNPAATSVAHLLIGGAGINIYHPVYRDGAETRTRAQRREALLGFAAGAFRVEDLATVASDSLPENVDVQILADGRVASGPSEPLEEASSAALEVADRSWLLVVRDPDRPSVTPPILIAVVGISLAALLGALILVWSRNEQLQRLQREASQDPLTGLKNRRRFEEDLRSEIARSRRDRVTGALLMLDLDNFKQVNDTLGHPIGDRAIEEIAEVLHGRMRETDVLARLGGDEFAIVLPRCDIEEAQSVAEAIAAGIRDHVPRREGVPPITVSIGLVMFGFGTDASFDSAIADADAAMYEAKQAGRDAVRIAGAARTA